jgi:hypothetical protein
MIKNVDYWSIKKSKENISICYEECLQCCSLYGEHSLKSLTVLEQQISQVEVQNNLVRCIKYSMKDKIVPCLYRDRL